MIELNFIFILTVASLISLGTSNASPLKENPIAQHIQDVRKKSADVQALPNNPNLNLFRKKAELDKTKKKDKGPHVHPALTTKFIQMVAQDDGPPDDGSSNDGESQDGPPNDGPPDDGSSNDGSSNDGSSNDGSSSDGSASDGSSSDGSSGDGSSSEDNSGDKQGDKSDDKQGDKSDDKKGDKPGNAGGGPEEITISVPKFQKDHMGNWIYHHWGATFGQVWGDTRFNNGRFTIPRIRVDSNAPNDYYPDGPRPTVCIGSTVYNVPRVKDWLRRNVYTEEHKHRPFWDNLRQIMFTQGNSEECHDESKYSDWKEYQECALRRNQRLEYMVPKYPAHQIGYRGSHIRNPENN
ncbi:hypothetical protein ACLKA6_003667 [Drosophila palustris]